MRSRLSSVRFESQADMWCTSRSPLMTKADGQGRSCRLKGDEGHWRRTSDESGVDLAERNSRLSPTVRAAGHKQARQRSRGAVCLVTTGAVTIATISALPPQAKAQQENGMALSVSARSSPPTDIAATFDIKFIASIASDYNFRGYTLSDHKPSISAN